MFGFSQNQSYNSISKSQENIDFNFSENFIQLQNNFKTEVLRFLNRKNLEEITNSVNLILPSEEKICLLMSRIDVLFQCVNGWELIEPIAEAINTDLELIWCLLVVVKASGSAFKSIPDIENMAAKAITILNVAEINFSGMDFRNIQIPGANLSQANCYNTDFQGANLIGVKMHGTWLVNAKLQKTYLTGIDFGEIPYLVHKSGVRSVAFYRDSNDRKYCLAGCRGGYVYQWDIITGKKVRDYKLALPRNGRVGKDVDFMTINQNTQQIAVGGGDDGVVEIWSLKTGRKTQIIYVDNMITTACFDFTGKFLALGLDHDPAVQLWKLPERSVELTLLDHQDTIVCIAFSSSGQWLASGSWDTSVRLWQLPEGTVRSIFKMSGHVYCIIFDPTNQWLVAGSSDHNIQLWHLSQAAIELNLKGHQGTVTSIAFNPTGQWLVSGSIDRTIRLWQLPEGRKGPILTGHTHYVNSVAFDPTEEWMLASGSDDDTVRLWKFPNEINQQTQNSPFNHSRYQFVVLDKSGQQLATGENGEHVSVWQLLQRTKKQLPIGFTSKVQCVAFDTKTEWLASGNEDGSVKLWQLPAGNLETTLVGHSGTIARVIFDTKGEWLASASSNNTIGLWQLPERRLKAILNGHKNLSCIVFSPNGQWLASGGGVLDNRIRLWKLPEAKRGPVLYTAKSNAVSCIAFSPDSQWLASGEGFDGITVQFWRLPEGTAGIVLNEAENNPPFMIYHPLRAITCIAFDSTGQWLVSGSSDHIVRLWELPNGSCVQKISFWDKVSSFTFSHPFNLIVAGITGRVGYVNFEKPGQGRFSWYHRPPSLGLEGANFTESVGLSELNQRLCREYGAIGVEVKPNLNDIGFSGFFDSFNKITPQSLILEEGSPLKKIKLGLSAGEKLIGGFSSWLPSFPNFFNEIMSQTLILEEESPLKKIKLDLSVGEKLMRGISPWLSSFFKKETSQQSINKNQDSKSPSEREEDIQFNFHGNFIESQNDIEEKIIKFLDYENLKKMTKAVNLILPSQDKISVLIHRITYLIQSLQNEELIDPIAEGVNPELIWCLLVIIKSSAGILQNIPGMEIEKAAARGITILNVAKISFSGMDLSGIKIPGANLQGAIMDSANLKKSYLNGVLFSDAFLKDVDFSESDMNKVDFLQKPFLPNHGKINAIAYIALQNLLFCATSTGEGVHGIQILSLKEGSFGYVVNYAANTCRSLLEVTNLALSCSGEFLVTLHKGHTREENEFRIWKVNYNQNTVKVSEIKRIEGDDELKSVAMSPNSTFFAIGGYKRCLIYNLSKTELYSVIDLEDDVFVNGISFSHDSSLLCFITDYYQPTLYVYDAKLLELKEQITFSNNIDLTFIVFSPNDKQIVVGTQNGHFFVISTNNWNKDEVSVGVNEVVRTACFDPDGNFVFFAIEGNNVIYVYDIKIKEIVSKIDSRTVSNIAGIICIKEIDHFVIMIADSLGNIRQWELSLDAESKLKKSDVLCELKINNFAISEKFSRILEIAEEENNNKYYLRQRSLINGELLSKEELDFEPLCLGAHPAGHIVAIGGRNKHNENVDSILILLKIIYSKEEENTESLGSIAFYNICTNQFLKFELDVQILDVDVVIFSHDGGLFSIANQYKQELAVYVVEYSSANQLKFKKIFTDRFPTRIWHLAFTRDNKFLLARTNECIRIYNVDELRSPSTTVSRRTIFMDLDGEYFVSEAITHSEGSFHFFLRDGKKYDLFYEFRGHQEGVKCVVCSPKRDFIVSGSEDGEIIFWKFPDVDDFLRYDLKSQENKVGLILYRLNNYFLHSIEQLSFNSVGHLVVRIDNGELSCWKIDYDQIQSQFSCLMLWSASNPSLYLKGVQYAEIQNLSKDNRMLLSQNGAKDPQDKEELFGKLEGNFHNELQDLVTDDCFNDLKMDVIEDQQSVSDLIFSDYFCSKEDNQEACNLKNKGYKNNK